MNSRYEELQARAEVLADLDAEVGELIEGHESRRTLWFPGELLAAAPDTDPGAHARTLRARAEGISLPVRIALCLNTLTEEGLPHFHRIFAQHVAPDSNLMRWNNLWTAEEDRHGAVMRDYARDTGILDIPALERMQFEYMREGFEPGFEGDPYRVFVYTTLQERATQVSHSNTGRQAGETEPLVGKVLSSVATDEARHYAFYRAVFTGILARDPDRALVSAAAVMPAIDMPGIRMPHFREMAEVVRRAGIYGPREYIRIVEEQIRHWAIGSLTGLGEAGRRAQEKILAIPARLGRVADAVEARSRARTFSFEVAFAREFGMA